MNRGSNLGRAARLCAVADNTAHIAQGVGDGVGNVSVITARHVGDGRTRTAGRAHRAAESRERTDEVLDVNGDQVTHNQRAVEPLFR